MHPDLYKTQLCTDGRNCRRSVSLITKLVIGAAPRPQVMCEGATPGMILPFTHFNASKAMNHLPRKH